MRDFHFFGSGFISGVFVTLLLLLVALSLEGCAGHIEEPPTASVSPTCNDTYDGCANAAASRFSDDQIGRVLFFWRLYECSEDHGMCVAKSSTASCDAACHPAYSMHACDTTCRYSRTGIMPAEESGE